MKTPLYICRGTGCKVRSTDQSKLDSHILSDGACSSFSYTISEVDDAVA